MRTRKNPSAVALGRLGGAATKGIPKRYSPEELARRTLILRKWQEKQRKLKERETQ